MAKPNPYEKRSLTTGEVAKMCGVNFRTVIRWIQRGHIKAYKLPGRGDNRILVKEFLKFLRKNDMPIPEELENPARRVLVVDGDEKSAKSIERALKRAGFEVSVAASALAGGVLAHSFEPAVVVVDPVSEGVGGLASLGLIRATPALAGVKLLAVSAEGGDEALAAGADAALSKPFKGPALVEEVADLAGFDLEQ